LAVGFAVRNATDAAGRIFSDGGHCVQVLHAGKPLTFARRLYTSDVEPAALRALQAAGKCQKAIPQGLKPIDSEHFMSELKLRPPTERDFFRKLFILINVTMLQEHFQGGHSTKQAGLAAVVRTAALQAAKKVPSEKILVSQRFLPTLNLLHLPRPHSQEWLCHGTFSANCLAGPDAGGEGADGGEAKLFVELDGGAVFGCNRQGQLPEIHGAQRFG
jgi:hypothetical protein